MSEDSVSMISDTISTGKPVYIIRVSNLKMKIRNFIHKLKINGVVRNFEGKLNSWSYKKINESQRISKIIGEIL